MKEKLRQLGRKIINNNIFWAVIKPFAKFGFFAYHNRKRPVVEITPENFPYLSIFNSLEVLHGPFSGMKYPSLTSAGSALYPKLIGSYERELHETIDQLLSNNYTEILDIGCAEGYYAVGLATKLGDTKIYAYDTDETARSLCLQMAKLNQVEDKLIIKKTCTAADLKDFKFNGKSLIICDCEGYEHILFNASNIKNLANCDLLIETHDFLDLNISFDLDKLFNKTHHIQTIKSIDDIEKVKTYFYQETNGLTLEKKLKIYQECRPSIIEWLYCTPKK